MKKHAPLHSIDADQREYYDTLATRFRDTSNITLIETLPREGVACVLEELLHMALAEDDEHAMLVCRVLTLSPRADVRKRAHGH